jgi:high-affinity Fe2+/Pb2+ permease
MLLMTLIQENATSSFDDLGKLLLYGVAAAIVVAVGFTVLRFRMRDKKPPTSPFISITDKDPSSSV